MKLKLETPLDKTWITSDTHFGHKNIIKFCNRPFSSVDEMDEIMIERWNARVAPDDVVFHLGDFARWDQGIAWVEYAQRLNGKITLVRGNHDERIGENINPCLFENTVDYVELVIGNLKRLIMSHYPMAVWNCSHIGSYHAHGHCHGSKEMCGIKSRRLDVGVDHKGSDFAPMSLAEFFQKADNV